MRGSAQRVPRKSHGLFRGRSSKRQSRPEPKLRACRTTLPVERSAKKALTFILHHVTKGHRQRADARASGLQRLRTKMMTQIAFTLSAKTDLDMLVEVEHPSLRDAKSLIADMMHVEDFGSHTAEIGDSVEIDDQEHAITGTEITVLFFADSARAGISNNGGTQWTDASSIEDAVRRYHRDQMQG